MTSPVAPSVNVNASASGTPAKFEATPEKVISAAPRKRGSPPRMTAYASRKPKIPPITAVTTLISMLARNASTIVGWLRSA